jgi:hypothetical protein
MGGINVCIYVYICVCVSLKNGTVNDVKCTCTKNMDDRMGVPWNGTFLSVPLAIKHGNGMPLGSYPSPSMIFRSNPPFGTEDFQCHRWPKGSCSNAEGTTGANHAVLECPRKRKRDFEDSVASPDGGWTKSIGTWESTNKRWFNGS